MKFLFILFYFSGFLIFLSGCNNKGGGNSAVPQKSVEELKKEVLSAACDEDIKKEYEEEIERKSKKLNENQLKKALQKMKENIKCG